MAFELSVFLCFTGSFVFQFKTAGKSGLKLLKSPLGIKRVLDLWHMARPLGVWEWNTPDWQLKYFQRWKTGSEERLYGSGEWRDRSKGKRDYKWEEENPQRMNKRWTEEMWNCRASWEILIRERPHSSQTHSNTASFFLAAPLASLQCIIGKLTFTVTHNPLKKLLHPHNTAPDINFSHFILDYMF